jgi:demethoxyubiquinone hydroxylase (CLK1/Coq7/Cat5 family)
MFTPAGEIQVRPSLPLPLADGLVFALPAFSARLSSSYKTDRQASPLLVC